MKRHLIITLTLVALVAAYAFASVRLQVPKDWPGIPAYAQISHIQPFGEEIYHTDEWAAIPFYRNPGCVPPDFNLLDMMDPPRCFDCPMTVEGFEIWPVPPDQGGLGPSQGKYWGLGAVPIYFVSWPELQTAVADGNLTITELVALPSLQIGSAGFYSLVLHPSGGPANVPHIEISARGVLLNDGRQFQFQVAGGDQSALVKHIKIVFW
jgi:hypothetical protein